MKRGVVASAHVISALRDGFTLERGVSVEEVSFYALYWDRVVLPTNNIMNVRVHDEAMLVDCGLIERPRVIFNESINSEDLPSHLSKIQVDTAKSLIESNSDVDWVLHQVGDKLILPGVAVDQKRSLRFELINALPVPLGTVLVPDILDFKERRADELHILHDAIDSLYLEVLKSPDQDLSAKKAVVDLKKAISDLNAVSSERWSVTSKFDFSVNFNLDGGKIASAFAAGAAFDFFSNMFTAPVGTLAAPFISMLSIKSGHSTAIQASQKENKLSYLSHAHAEKIIMG
ncbi:DUF6236 family protein [Pseudomonas mucidolens]|uniref:Uncharacterized protein n=1 Tax=Pseudomonas mucidolens TaxID=46679 RepID=A0A1H2M4M5_9PSED|nr:DUF6236 family protein [Pseudomonas mucidolens]SDU87898.1 hypothetical protein SAMN05216202_0981 [Pseudomonas mucidolens]SQH34591.1 Uncharacterised protein [Pseudomonas mucidolens]